MTSGKTSNDFELQNIKSHQNSLGPFPIQSPPNSPKNIDVVPNQKQELANRAKASSFSNSYRVKNEWEGNDTKESSCGISESVDDVHVRYSNDIDLDMPLGTRSWRQQSKNSPPPGLEGSSHELLKGKLHAISVKEESGSQHLQLSRVPTQKSLLPPIILNIEDSDHSNNIASRFFESDSDTSAKNAYISQMNKLHRHKPSSYCFKEIVAPNNNPYIPRDDLPFDTESESSESSPSPVVSNVDVTTVKSKRRFFTSTNLLVTLLVIWAVCSVYFIVYGTSWSFNNYLKSLPDSKKQELVEELNLRYATILGKNEISERYIKPTPAPILKGLVYNPPSSNLPKCGLSRSAVARDLKKISAITTKIKTYGTQCNQAAYILDAISEHNLDLTLSLGIWLNDDWNLNSDQILIAKSILKTYDPRMIDSVIVGSGTLHNEDLDELSLVQYINDIKDFVFSNKLDIPVGTADSPEYLTASLVNSCDIIGIHLQPFLSGISSEQATSWALKNFEETKEVFGNGHTSFLVSEIGWPYQGGNFRQAVASPKDAQVFLDSWVCKQSEVDYYYFEAFDEPWKKIFNTEENYWESEWGIFSFQRHEKSNLTLPSCD